MVEVYGDIHSGNCYKVKLLLCLIGIEHRSMPISMLPREVGFRWTRFPMCGSGWVGSRAFLAT